ncbi:MULTISPECIES: HlyD family secretion protein [unclassified Carboxylicivirga]|uniref:HlyD family secretion protein n=1 Tax=Carboxylicivirga TaxID=1628153 RepID=UPI003D327D73
MKALLKWQIGLVALMAIACQNKTIDGPQGKVKRDALMVVSKYPGRILSIYAQEGQRVNKGDTLMLLDMPEVEAKLNQAEGAVSAAKAQYEMALKGATNEQLEQVMAKLDAVSEQYRFAEKSYKRINNMFKDSMVSVQQHDEVYMKYQAAKAQYNGVKAKYEEVKKGVRNEKVQMALGDYERAKGARQEGLVAFAERYIVAPQAMTIETIALHEGELVLPGYGIATGYQLDKAFFRFTIAEGQIHNYKVGETVDILSPFDGKSYRATIVAIKQLTRYADVTSAFPEYQLGESIYELKAVPEKGTDVSELLTNISVIIK